MHTNTPTQQSRDNDVDDFVIRRMIKKKKYLECMDENKHNMHVCGEKEKEGERKKERKVTHTVNICCNMEEKT